MLPTYDERENVSRIVGAILEQDPDLQVLVVDDASPDGTGEVVEELAKEDPRVRALHRRRKAGLGTAYVEGFRKALGETDARFVLQMDADFSHDPAEIPRLLAACETADVAIGSRYCDGVRVLNWPLRRLAVSVLANLYAAAVTGLPVRDLTSGFKCYRRSALEQIPLGEIRSDGYAFQIEIVHAAARRGLRVREVPIIFSDRVDGRSKLSRWVVWEAAWLVWWLRLSRGRGAAPDRDRARLDEGLG